MDRLFTYTNFSYFIKRNCFPKLVLTADISHTNVRNKPKFEKIVSLFFMKMQCAQIAYSFFLLRALHALEAALCRHPIILLNIFVTSRQQQIDASRFAHLSLQQRLHLRTTCMLTRICATLTYQYQRRRTEHPILISRNQNFGLKVSKRGQIWQISISKKNVKKYNPLYR